MKSDITRSTFRPAKRFSGVRQQQGRVQLDADWNEQVDIVTNRIEIGTEDIIGASGGPIGGAGFGLTGGATVRIGVGDYYVDGILIQNDVDMAFSSQKDWPGLVLPTTDGTYVGYLHVFQRHITALEDPDIRESALGGPDTCTRSRTTWQVGLLPVSGTGINCLTNLPEWNALIAPSTIKLAAQSDPSDPAPKPCIVPASAGFRRLENQLYRVEIHDAGANQTFKWSRENGSVVTKWLGKTGNVLTVSNAGKDSTTSFAAGNWIELFDDSSDLLQKPGTMVRIVSVDGAELTIDPTTATGSLTFADFKLNPRIRRWDSDGLIPVPNTNAPVDLEDGVQVMFTAGRAHTGDYWTIPARVVKGDVEWERDGGGNPVPLLPEGMAHHFAKIAIAERAGTWSITDCRNLYPVLADIVDLFYVSGEGQDAMPDVGAPTSLVPLAEPLQVGVARGEYPRAGVAVSFTAEAGAAGSLNGTVLTTTIRSVNVATDANGLATCTWEIDPARKIQQVTARMIDDLGNPFGLPVTFTAQLSTADQVAYTPDPDCTTLSAAKTVQEALDILCMTDSGNDCCELSVGEGCDYPTLEAALDDLLVKKKRKSIALCLLAQETEHKSKGYAGAGTDLANIRIRGAGRASRLELENPLVFRKSNSVSISEIQISATKSDFAIVGEGAKELFVSRCAITVSGTSPATAAILGRDNDRLVVSGNSILATFFTTENRFLQLKDFDAGIAKLMLLSDSEFEEQIGPEIERISAVKASDRIKQVDKFTTLAVERAVGIAEITQPAFKRVSGEDAFGGLKKSYRASKVSGENLRAAIEEVRGVLRLNSPAACVHFGSLGTSATIEDNLMAGNVVMYEGVATEISGDLFDNLVGSTKDLTLNLTDAGVWIRGNRFIRFLLGKSVSDIVSGKAQSAPLTVYREIRFEDNTIEASASVGLSFVQIYDGNLWTFEGTAALSVCRRAILTGNIILGGGSFFEGSPQVIPTGMRETNLMNIIG